MQLRPFQPRSFLDENIFYTIFFYSLSLFHFSHPSVMTDRLCGVVVRVSGYRFRGLGFDSRPYQIFWEVGDLERGPLSLMRTIE
jgi:hypothetical protein